MAVEGKRKGFRAFARRWGLLILVGIVLAALTAVDFHLKNAGEAIGFHPENASCVVQSADFPAFSRDLANTDEAERFTQETPRPLDFFELAVRKTTGVRPTPLRWNVWLGPRFVWAKWQDTHGMCVHPGLLLRALHFLSAEKAGEAGEQELYVYAGYRYAWRDGYLIISPDPRYVLAALEAPPAPPLPATSSNSLFVHWPDGELRVSPSPGIPVQGTLNLATKTADEPLLLSGAWPEDSLFTLTTRSPETAIALWDAVRTPFETTVLYGHVSRLAGDAWAHWNLDPPSEGWKRHTAEFSVALMAMHTGESLPIPEWGAMMRAPGANGISEHPWAAAIAPFSPIEYAWEGRPGLVATLLGEEFAVCLAHDGDRWLAVSRQDRMTELLAIQPTGTEIGSDILLEINWETTGRTAEAVLRKAGELHLIPEMNAQEVDAYIAKYARSIAQMGRLRITASAAGDHVAFEGTLANFDEEEGAP